MSSLRVEIVRVGKILEHPNADRLEIAEVYAWSVVVKKGEWKEGDVGVFFPIESVLPLSLESYLFPEDSKIKLDKGRIRAIRIRGVISTGMLVPVPELVTYCVNTFSSWTDTQALKLFTLGEVGTDLTSLLGVTKYEPPVPEFQSSIGSVQRNVKGNPSFSKYTDIENIRNFPTVFEEGEPVILTEKVHGTSVRFGYVPLYKPSIWKRFLVLLGISSRYEFLYGSRNVQMRLGKTYKTFYGDDVYSKIAQKYQFDTKLKDGECVFGEIYGGGIQKGYDYGMKGEIDFVAYDISQDGFFLDYPFFVTRATDLNIPLVPYITTIPYSLDKIKEYSEGRSLLNPVQEHREGVVIKPIAERNHPAIGRLVLKSINQNYLLLKNGSDFH